MKLTNSSAIVFTCLMLSACAPPVSLHGSVYEDPSPAPALDLLTLEGAPFQLDELGGQIVLILFGYTSCPDVCPATLSEVNWVFEQLASEDRHVEFLFVTVDPTRDSPETIKGHLGLFNPRFIGLHGTESQLAQAKQGYAVYAERDAGEGDFYTVTHTSRIFLVDQDGLLRTNYTFDVAPQMLLADIRSLLGGG
jgi:protein SCO1/2